LLIAVCGLIFAQSPASRPTAGVFELVAGSLIVCCEAVALAFGSLAFRRRARDGALGLAIWSFVAGSAFLMAGAVVLFIELVVIRFSR